jgi:RsiW-degrading membrane proteinase PrsW (M82 family)
MNTLISIIISLLPIIVISIVIVLFDKEKEPIFSYIKCYLLGIFAVCIILAINKYLIKSGIPSEVDALKYLFYSFITVALLEETFKYISVLISTKLDKNCNSYYDSIIYAAFVSLGFACFENIIYLFNQNLIMRDVIYRAIFSVPNHVIFAIFMGKFLELSRVKPKKKILYLLLSLIIPVLLHGLYDFMVLYVPHLIRDDVGFYFFLGAFELILYTLGIREVVISSKKSDKLLVENN